MTIASKQESRGTESRLPFETPRNIASGRQQKDEPRFRDPPKLDEQLSEVIERAVRELVERLGKAPLGVPGSPLVEQDEHVLLDLEVDDVRCLLIRRTQPSPLDLLSPREREIARMAAVGYPNKAIAAVLQISSWTVSSHLRRVFDKLGVCSRAAMATRIAGDEISASLPTPAADSE